MRVAEIDSGDEEIGRGILGLRDHVRERPPFMAKNTPDVPVAPLADFAEVTAGVRDYNFTATLQASS